MNPKADIQLVNKTPYFIRYKKGDKIQSYASFSVDEEISIEDIEVWYGRKWTKKSQICITDNSIFFIKKLTKKYIPKMINTNLFQTIHKKISNSNIFN